MAIKSFTPILFVQIFKKFKECDEEELLKVLSPLKQHIFTCIFISVSYRNACTEVLILLIALIISKCTIVIHIFNQEVNPFLIYYTRFCERVFGALNLSAF
jgi:hypothetical protein